VHYLAGLPWLLALMLGAAVGSTSPAVIVPLVKRLDMSEHSRTILFLESAISDVLSIVVALAFLGAYLLGHVQVGEVLGRILASFLLAGLIGVASGLFWSFLLKEIRTIPNTNFTTLAFVFVVFGVPELLGYSGFIAALAFGITLGNIKAFNLRPLKRIINKDLITFNTKEKFFFAEVVFLLKTFFFLYVGISMQLTNWWPMVLGMAAVALVYFFRVPVVRLSVPATIPKADAAYMAVTAPKGLAAVVLASVPLQHNIPEGQIMQNITYNIVLLSIVMTSLLVFLQGHTRLSSVYQFLAGRGGDPGAVPERARKNKPDDLRK
jgi:NhaP-type Na+/H+ or K+/H+ antiporter